MLITSLVVGAVVVIGAVWSLLQGALAERAQLLARHDGQTVTPKPFWRHLLMGPGLILFVGVWIVLLCGAGIARLTRFTPWRSYSPGEISDRSW